MKEKADEIIKIINQISGRYSNIIVFDDWIKMIAIATSNATVLHDELWQKREQQYIDIYNKYNHEEQELLKKAFVMLILAFEYDIDDYLGYIYMKCEMGNSRTGQFFTPFNLSELTAKLTEDKQSKEIINLYEPTCGSGGMILAYCKKLKEQQINYQRKIKVVAQDLDYRAVYMTYIQLSYYGVKAKVCQGDTLAEPVVTDPERIFYTPNWKGFFI